MQDQVVVKTGCAKNRQILKENAFTHQIGQIEFINLLLKVTFKISILQK